MHRAGVFIHPDGTNFEKANNYLQRAILMNIIDQDETEQFDEVVQLKRANAYLEKEEEKKRKRNNC